MFPSELTYFSVACALNPVKQNLSATCIRLAGILFNPICSFTVDFSSQKMTFIPNLGIFKVPFLLSF